jgi:hypothetical protein
MLIDRGRERRMLLCRWRFQSCRLSAKSFQRHGGGPDGTVSLETDPLPSVIRDTVRGRDS